MSALRLIEGRAGFRLQTSKQRLNLTVAEARALNVTEGTDGFDDHETA